MDKIYKYRLILIFFQTSGADHRVDVSNDKFARLDWLFPETTKNFTRLPIQYRVSKMKKRTNIT